MNAPVLQLIDSILLGYTVGDVLLLVTILGVVGTLVVKRSMKLLALHLLSMGVLLVILPNGMLIPNPDSFLPTAPAYKAAGLVLVVISPVLFAVGRR